MNAEQPLDARTLAKRLRQWADYETIPNGDRPRSDMRSAAKMLSALSAPTPAAPALRTPPVADPNALTPRHIELLKRGAAERWIWLSDDAGRHTAEVVALGELRRAGLVEQDPGPFPPGPASMPPYLITEAGRRALASATNGAQP